MSRKSKLVSCWDCIHHYHGGTVVFGNCGCAINSEHHNDPDEDDWDACERTRHDCPYFQLA